MASTTGWCPITRPSSSPGPCARRACRWTSTRRPARRPATRPTTRGCSRPMRPDMPRSGRVTSSSTRGSTSSRRSPAATGRRRATATSRSTARHRRRSRPTPAGRRAAARRAPSFYGSGPAGGGTGGGAGCGDTLAPAVSLRVIRRGRNPILRGRASDRGCSALLRVRLAVARVGAKRCRFVTRPRTGRLSRPRSCTRNRIFLRPRGTARFRLALRHLRTGRYRVTVAATDRAGNVRRVTRTLRVRV